MKRWPIVFAALIVVVGCNNSNPTTASGAKTLESDFTVALITPTETNDGGWSAIAADGLAGIKEELGYKTLNSVAASPQEINDAMRSYAQKGVNLVIGHGYEYNQHGIDNGKDFPKTIFVSSSGSATSENVGCFRFVLEEAMYVLGVVAATKSKTGIIAMIGGPDVPSIQSTFDGFEQGAKSVRADIKVIRVFTGSNDDLGKAKAQTLTLIHEGADMIIHQANKAAQAVFDACKERKVSAFGTNSDQASAAPETILGSAVIVARPAFIELAKQVKEGRYKGGVLEMDMNSGSVGVVWNPLLESEISADLRALVDSTITKIKSGEITVSKREF